MIRTPPSGWKLANPADPGSRYPNANHIVRDAWRSPVAVVADDENRAEELRDREVRRAKAEGFDRSRVPAVEVVYNERYDRP